MGNCEARRFHVTIAAASDVHELISCKKKVVVFFSLLQNNLSHLRLPLEKKRYPWPITGNVLCMSEKLARAALALAFNVWHGGSVGQHGMRHLHMCEGNSSRYKLFCSMRTQPHRGPAQTGPASIHPSRCVCLLPSLYLHNNRNPTPSSQPISRKIPSQRLMQHQRPQRHL